MVMVGSSCTDGSPLTKSEGRRAEAMMMRLEMLYLVMIEKLVFQNVSKDLLIRYEKAPAEYMCSTMNF